MRSERREGRERCERRVRSERRERRERCENQFFIKNRGKDKKGFGKTFHRKRLIANSTGERLSTKKTTFARRLSILYILVVGRPGS